MSNPYPSPKRFYVHDSNIGEFGESFDKLEEALLNAENYSDTYWGNVYVVVDTAYEGEEMSKNVPAIGYLGVIYIPEVQDKTLPSVP